MGSSSVSDKLSGTMPLPLSPDLSYSVFWGAAIVFFLAKFINFHNANTQGFWVEVSSQVVCGTLLSLCSGAVRNADLV